MPPNNKEQQQKSDQSPEDIQRQLEEIVIDVLGISHSCVRVAKNIFRLGKAYEELLAVIDRPDIISFIEQHNDISKIISLGFYVRALNALLEMGTEADKFMNDRSTGITSPQVLKRYGDEVSLAGYLKRYRSFRSIQELVKGEATDQIASWMNKVPDSRYLSPDNPYLDLVLSHRSLGEILILVAREQQKPGKNGEYLLDSSVYTRVMEILLSVVREEAAEALEPTIHSDEVVLKEQLSKVIFDLVSSFGYPHEAVAPSKVPGLLRDPYKLGLPLYRLLHSCVKQLPDALFNEDHPGHRVTANVVHTLNEFRVPDLTFNARNITSLFTVTLTAGLIREEYAGNCKLQEHLERLSQLSIEAGPTRDWYEQLAIDVVSSISRFSHRVITQGAEVRTRIFDHNRDVLYQDGLEGLLTRIFEAGKYTEMDVKVDQSVFPIQETNIRGAVYTSSIRVQKVENGNFLIDVVITVGESIDYPDDQGVQLEQTRFYCQLKLVDGRIDYHIPVPHRDQVGDEGEEAIYSHVSQVLRSIDIDALRERTQSERTTQPAKHPEVSARPQTAKSRLERMDEHRSSKMRTEQAQPISNLTNNRSPDCSPSEIDIEQGEDSALPEQAIYVPQELILSDELSRELGQSRKKGPRAKLMEELRVFLEEYKITGRQKPGKGNHYKSLVGPNGQRIWRFSISYQNRCLAVEVDDGKAIIVFVGDHDFVYGNNKRALLKIRKALTQLND